MSRHTYHLVPTATWIAHPRDTPYAAPSLASEGFIHCTDGAEALLATARRHYRDDPREFTVLTLDLERTGSPWRFDDPGAVYPHVYGTIDPLAVVASVPIGRTPEGDFLPFVVDGSAA